MLSIHAYRDAFVSHLEQHIVTREPVNLYNPMNYILGLGGKRLRPVLTLMTADIFGNDYKKAMNAAMAIEIFHNFSLIHDDIMDDAPLRRGKETVHEKWDLNTGILSGDVMLIVAYQFFERYDPEVFHKLAKLFSKTAIEVCEGQQYDIDFETRDDVTIDEYLKMITYKTAVLVGAAMEMGAIVTHADENDAKAIYDFGMNLGIAFQIKDDYLDAFGDPKSFGKQIGGDIIENKKTFLYLKTIEELGNDEAEQLLHLYAIAPADPSAKIQTVKELMASSGAVDATLKAIENYTKKALDILNGLNISAEKKETLVSFANILMGREV
ncbi:polyprenyl synthetase family protein [Galbibacter pacificus]|uniref:Polyprenyl synthetase family protein n=1 Tax=Galbibacter pacificus TaxID=2996052 RepID=A0ABT6FSB3_9FLAO|nr:polyprenyl synthetase family protein [Galbibacter pacificus]MDG3582722.1 polyprenyl synthetase family protein [Galbibacter pacificus]MDG3586159.1 polyprenyl synthetase family protein [Galbibacter pacificus]